MRIAHIPGHELNSTYYFIGCADKDHANMLIDSMIEHKANLKKITGMDFSMYALHGEKEIEFIYWNDMPMPENAWAYIEKLWRKARADSLAQRVRVMLAQ